MRSPTRADAEQQFQTYGRHISNLDRCNRCGAPRSAHGADWGCPTRPGHATAAVSLILGFLLAFGSLIVQIAARAYHTTAQTTATLAAILIGVTLLVAGTIMARPPR
jgi:hypothetical protein